MTPIIFLHGLESNNRGFKANLLRSLFPDILIPDFSADLPDGLENLPELLRGRMRKLTEALYRQENITIIGSSFGGLMATLFARKHPERVRKMILLAPAIHRLEASGLVEQPLTLPVTLYHGLQDTIVPFAAIREVASGLFANLEFHEVDDGHALNTITAQLDWRRLV